LHFFFLNLLVGEVSFEFDVFINTKKKKYQLWYNSWQPHYTLIGLL